MRRSPPMPFWLGLGSSLVCMLGAETAHADGLIQPGGLFHEATSHEKSDTRAVFAERRAREETRAIRTFRSYSAFA